MQFSIKQNKTKKGTQFLYPIKVYILIKQYFHFKQADMKVVDHQISAEHRNLYFSK